MEGFDAKKKRVSNSRKRVLEAARKLPAAIIIQKKIECDAKALTIVERLIEPEVSEEWLLENLEKINRSHLEDVIEERAIMRLCGYALCDNPLTKVINKKYEISTLRNKVYDVQKTKNFCSFWCYSASEFLLEQMLTSPLWYRFKVEIPVFTTFKKCRKTMKNPPGVEINIREIPISVDVDPEEDTSSKGNNTENEHSKNITVSDDDSSFGDSKKLIKNTAMLKNTGKLKENEQKPAVSFGCSTAYREKSITEGMTKDTTDVIDEDNAKRQILDNSKSHDTYERLCTKLNTLRLEQEKEQGVNGNQSMKLKPLPDFSILIKDGETLQIKEANILLRKLQQ